MRTPVAIGIALGCVLGLVFLALSQQADDAVPNEKGGAPDSSGMSVARGVRAEGSGISPSMGIDLGNGSAVGTSVAPTVVIPSDPETVVDSRPESGDASAVASMEAPPTGADQLRQWHVHSVLPQWKSLNAALKRSGREQFRAPIQHLVAEMEALQGEVTEEEYRALLASEQQLVNAIRVHHPGLWPIEESLSFLEESLKALAP